MANNKKASAKTITKSYSQRTINATYSKSGPGLKSAFKGRKDTIFRKGQELHEQTGAYFLGLIYQPHRRTYHICVSKDENDQSHEWPFPVEEFLSSYNPPPIVTSVETGTEANSDWEDDQDIMVCTGTPVLLTSVPNGQSSSSPKQHKLPAILETLITRPPPISTAQFSPLDIFKDHHLADLFGSKANGGNAEGRK